MSSSKSNQSSTYNTSTSYEYNTLDGGAIKEAFDFAGDQSRWAFEFGNKTVSGIENVAGDALSGMENVTGDALSGMEAALGMSYMWASDIAGEAFDSIDSMSASNQNQLNEMAQLTKSIQTQGATELINATASQNKTLYTTIGVVIVAFILILFLSNRGRKS